MTGHTVETLTSRDPATGEILREIPLTPIEALPAIFQKARAAQSIWAMTPLKQRAQLLIQLREALVNHVDDITDLIVRENGKPRFEAMAHELIPSADLATFFSKRGPKALSDRRIPLSLMKHRKSTLNYWPLGVVAVITPWNYPFLLPWGEIVMALISGNAIIFKPSEITPLVGLKIQALIDEAGFPPDLVQTLIGDGKLGAAIIQNKPNKIFFTGSVATGKTIMRAASEHLIPVSLELGGKDAMLVLPDADLDFASSAALWGAYTNSGQMCASVERILVHENHEAEFTRLLANKLAKLRQGNSNSGDNDLGVVTFSKQKDVYDRQLAQARSHGVEFVTGGDWNADRTALRPTILKGKDLESSIAYREETFGPTVAIATYRSLNEAVKKSNDSQYGLLGSVITRDLSLGDRVARQLEVGTVTINEVCYTAGLPETPWGGLKDSGIGRTHSEMGLHEFVNIRHIHRPRARFLVFKSLWWFPYTTFQYATFRQMFGLYRKHWLDKLRAIPHILWNLAQMIKLEKRL